MKTISLFYSTHTVHTTGEGQQLLHYYFVVVVQWCKQHLKMLQEKPCKHPIHPMKKLKCKAFLHLSFTSPPLRERLKYLKQFTGVCTKGMGFFFSFFLFVTTWREKNRWNANAFSHSKRTADLLVALNVIINKTNFKKRLMLTCEGVKPSSEMKMECWKDCTSMTKKHLRLPAFFLRDAIEGFFDKVANSTKK